MSISILGNGVPSAVPGREDRRHPALLPRLRDHRPLQVRHRRVPAGLQQTHLRPQGKVAV